MADTLDLLTLAEGRVAIGLEAGDGSQDESLALAITGVSREFDREFGAMVARSAVETFNGEGTAVVRVSERPILSVTSVTVNSTALASTEYYTDGDYGDLYRISGTSYRAFPCGIQNVVVSYEAGRYASTTAVDSRVKMAAVAGLKNWWRMWTSTVGSFGEYDVPAASFPSFALPNAAKGMLFDMRRLPGLA